MKAREQIFMEPGERYRVEFPYSEVCVHMGVAGRIGEVAIVGPRSAQLYVDGRPFSFPVTLGEAGIYEDNGRPYCYAQANYTGEGLS